MHSTFPWSEHGEPKHVNVSATHADLLILSQPDIKDDIKVYCRFCHGTIKYFENFQDPDESMFVCFSPPPSSYISLDMDHCLNKIKVWELPKASEKEMESRFYVKVPTQEKKIHKLEFEPNGYKTSYHYIRELTPEEYESAALENLDKLRRKAIERAAPGL